MINLSKNSFGAIPSSKGNLDVDFAFDGKSHAEHVGSMAPKRVFEEVYHLWKIVRLVQTNGARAM